MGKRCFYAAIALVGFGNSNIFPIILSRAMLYLPAKKNEISGLMVMGLIGGTLFPFAWVCCPMAWARNSVRCLSWQSGVVYLCVFAGVMRRS